MRHTLALFLLALVGGSFVVTPGRAADLAPVYRKAPPPAAVYSWTGCYVGIEAGGEWGNARSISLGVRNGTPNSTAGFLHNSSDISGGLVGGTLGCNYEVNKWVFGIEGDGSWSSATGSGPTPPPFNPNFRESLKTHWLATVRGRVGYAVKDNVLVYGTAGGAFGDLGAWEYDITTPAASALETHTFTGWTAGAGVEWGFAPSWSAKFEYLYVDLGKQNYFMFTPSACCTAQSTRLLDNIVRVGVNYHFNWTTPVAAKY